MNLVDELHAIARALAAKGIPYAVCGGVAVTPLAVVARATLVRMKQLAGRAQDLADLEKLEAVDDA